MNPRNATELQQNIKLVCNIFVDRVIHAVL